MTTGDFYRRLLSLYPPEFRQQFSEEMVSVFEQKAGERFADRKSASFAFLLTEFSSVVKGAYLMWLTKILPIDRNRSESRPAEPTAPILSLEQATKQRNIAIRNVVAAIGDPISSTRAAILTRKSVSSTFNRNYRAGRRRHTANSPDKAVALHINGRPQRSSILSRLNSICCTSKAAQRFGMLFLNQPPPGWEEASGGGHQTSVYKRFENRRLRGARRILQGRSLSIRLIA